MGASNESSTFRRLLRSQHVRDLRWIFFGALASTFLVAVFALAFKIHPILAETPTVAAPKATSDAYTWADTVKFILAIAAAGATVMAWAYQTGSKRLGVVDLFACEIATLCRVGTVVEFIPNMVAQYNAVGTAPKNPTPSVRVDALRFNSEENYFPVFESNAKDLQILEADVVNNVTAFYTYMKATRDMLRQLSDLHLNAGPPEAERKSVVNAVLWRKARNNSMASRRLPPNFGAWLPKLTTAPLT